MDTPTSAPSAQATISEAEANALDSSTEYLRQLREFIHEAMERQAKKTKQGMTWEMKE